MLRGIHTRSAVPIIVILFLFLSLNIIYVANSVKTFSDERSQERLKGAAQAAQAYLSRIERYSQMTARAISGDENIIRMIDEWNNQQKDSDARETLFRYLGDVKSAYGISAVVIADKNGEVVLRTHQPDRYGDDGMVSPVLNAALNYGEVTTVYSATRVLPMGLSSAAPIEFRGEIIGAISAIADLSRLDFVDEFGEIFNAEVTIYARDISLASTLYLDREAGVRAIGTPAHPDVVETVLVAGMTFDDEIELFDELYYAYYFPLFGWEDEPVGMFFIGFSLEDSISDTNALVIHLILVNAVAFVVAALIIFQTKKHVDRTERHAIEAEAANKAKSEFLSTISHDIRTPLGAILGISEIQIRTMKSGEAKKAFEKIYTSGGMLLGLINDILDMSKIEAGKMELFTVNYEVASLINDTSQLNIMRMSSNSVNFEISVSDRIPSILHGDELRIKQILNNILSNAFKYTGSGTVKMEVSHKPMDYDNIFLIFKISDTGQGMTKEQVRRLFDKFTRFNAAENRNAEGTGLGMSIVRNLLKLMNGEIFVKSEPRKGSLFTVRIPQKIANATPVGKETSESLNKFKFSGQVKLRQSEWEPMPYGKILVVDDIDANIYVARGFLEPYMLQVDSAESGFEAIDKIKSGIEYDLILLDHMMPRMDGKETIRRIREMGCTLPIIAYTANALVGQQEDLLKKGFDGFLSKPIKGTALDAILKNHVRDKQPPEVLEAARTIENHIGTHSINLQVLYKDFARSQKDIISELQSALDENDFKTAELLAHTLKGLAAMIGEDDLMSLAGKAESAFRNQTTPAALINTLNAETENVLNAINEKIISAPTTAIINDKSEIKKILFNLKTQLSESNAEATNTISTLSAIEGTEKIIECIEKYDYDSALKYVDRFLNDV